MHIDDLMRRIRRLPVAKRKKLEEMVRSLEEGQPTAISAAAPDASPSVVPRPVRGLLRDLGSAPSGDDVDQARRELWAGFPREN
jgi:hypothetical protein